MKEDIAHFSKIIDGRVTEVIVRKRILYILFQDNGFGRLTTLEVARITTTINSLPAYQVYAKTTPG
jgi:hypothetical protein